MPVTAARSSQQGFLTTQLEFGAQPSAVGCARGHVRAVAHEWGLAGLADTAELLVSELVTNAVRASGRLRSRAGPAVVPVVGLRLVSDRVSIVIHVWDGCADLPVCHEARPDDESGRGMMIIASLAADWGSYPEAGGKVVWARATPGPRP